MQNPSFDFVTESEYIEDEGLLPNLFTTADIVHGPQQLCVLKLVNPSAWTFKYHGCGASGGSNL
jgi:hypothetical protein